MEINSLATSIKDNRVSKPRKNIILIGMPGCGKSTVGVVLAKKLNFQFIDTDLLIQNYTKERLSETIERVGNAGFLEIENKVLSEIEASGCVIATGGSAIYGKEAMAHLRKIGIIVYIKLPFWNLKQRLGDLKNRGVPLKPGQTLKDLYKERVPLYEKYAQIIVNTRGLYLRQSVKKIESAIYQYIKEMKSKSV